MNPLQGSPRTLHDDVAVDAWHYIEQQQRHVDDMLEHHLRCGKQLEHVLHDVDSGNHYLEFEDQLRMVH